MRCSLAFVLVGLLAAFPAAAQATWPGQPGRVVYHALDEDVSVREGIYSIGADGSGNRRLLRGVAGEVASSRNGRRIAYFRSGRQLWQARSDGSRAKRIVRLERGVVRGAGSDPAWSPDGRQLVFTLTHRFELVRESRSVWAVRRDGTGLRMLATGHDATWSSRGLIAYAEEDGDIVGIVPNGRRRPIWVPQGSPSVEELDFSPNGRRLVFGQTSSSFTRSTIRTVNVRTGARTSFRDSTKDITAQDVAWAPGGRRLAFLQRDQGQGPTELRTIRPDGTGTRTIFEFPLTPFGFAWQTR